MAGTCPECDAPLVKYMTAVAKKLEEAQPQLGVKTFRCKCWRVSVMELINGEWKWVSGPATRGRRIP